MMGAVERRAAHEQIAELVGRARAAHDARLALPRVRAFWLPPECRPGCACHPINGATEGAAGAPAAGGV